MPTPEPTISTVERLKNFVLDLLFPTACLECCQFSRTNLCLTCRDKLQLQNGFSCAFCRAPVVNGVTCPFCRRAHALDQLLVTLSYDQSLVKTTIKAFKYQFIQGLAPELAAVMTVYLEKLLKLNSVSMADAVFVPVPLAAARLRWRGYNQSGLLANALGAQFQRPVVPGLLTRVRNTKPQAELTNRDERIRNVAGAFHCPQPAVASGRTVIVIDDLSTTGSTLDQCAIVLKHAGAKRVVGLVLARG